MKLYRIPLVHGVQQPWQLKLNTRMETSRRKFPIFQTKFSQGKYRVSLPSLLVHTSNGSLFWWPPFWVIPPNERAIYPPKKATVNGARKTDTLTEQIPCSFHPLRLSNNLLWNMAHRNRWYTLLYYLTYDKHDSLPVNVDLYLLRILIVQFANRSLIRELKPSNRCLNPINSHDIFHSYPMIPIPNPNITL